MFTSIEQWTTRDQKSTIYVMSRILGICFLITMIVSPFLADASTVLRTGDGITVESDQVVEGDYYVSVGPVGSTVMSGDVTEDMYAFGGTVTANGTIGEDLGIIAGIAHMHASVTDDVRIVAGETIIAEQVGGDLFVLSGVLKILSSASIAGDIVFYGGEAEINGTVGGSIYGAANSVRIDGPVGGSVDIETTNNLTLGSRADIAGDVSYSENTLFSRAPDAHVEGSLTKVSGETEDSRDGARDFLMPLFLSLFSTLCLYLLFRPHLQKLVHVIDATYAKSSLIGIAALVLGPALSILLMVTVLGLYVGIMAFAATIVLYVASISIASIVLGAFIAKLFIKKAEVSLPWVLIGSLTLYGLAFIPVVGPLFIVVLVVLTAGGMMLQLRSFLS